jgi:hypothetical protein
VTTRNYDDWTIERWRTEPHYSSLDLDDPAPTDQAPALWKDLTLASVAAALLWATAAIVFG